MIGITGVTGKLGSYVADLVDQQGIASIHLARKRVSRVNCTVLRLPLTLFFLWLLGN